MKSLDYNDTLNIAYLLKNILLLVPNVLPWDKDRGEGLYLKVRRHGYISLSEDDMKSVKKILDTIHYSIRSENEKLIIKRNN